nr:preprotein translocase subunit SecG [Paracoccus shandongensis]
MTIHLILAVLLTGVVLLQRSEGGGLGMGGGGGVMTGRQAANALTRLTWIFGIALFVTSIALTIIAARQVSNSSIMDQLGVPEGRQESTLPQVPAYVPPPSTGAAGDPLTPPAPEAATDPATPEAAAPAADAPAVEPVAPPAAPAPAAPAPAN